MEHQRLPSYYPNLKYHAHGETPRDTDDLAGLRIGYLHNVGYDQDSKNMIISAFTNDPICFKSPQKVIEPNHNRKWQTAREAGSVTS